MNLHIINGPNLNLLGIRQPELYGSRTFESYFLQLQNQFKNHSIYYFQSNVEGILIDKLHEIGFNSDGIIINAGGYTHTSVAIGDALASITAPVIEVHISNIYAREPFRHQSYLSRHCKAVIAGAGLSGYSFALQLLTQQNDFSK
ncbi:MAG: 3-dehydroquinate dehydratase [Bacteroidia bacterium]|nr:3-dehydroquinate dehydratase [Bacteroidia bacterium]HQV01016.1 type II 3-dehydroquinate dehydratase [Bacteroidia bacterium]